MRLVSRRAAFLYPSAWRSSWVVPVATAILWCAAAQLLYRPFEPHPFDILDFPELLPLLRGAHSFNERFVDLVEYYGTRGRFSIGTYALLVLNYEAWGENTIGWQVARAMQLAGASAILFVLLRRWGASVWGAAASAMLLICARSAAANWPRLIASESLGLLTVLTMLWIATGFGSSRHRSFRTTMICVVLGILISLKEVWVAILPAAWVVALVTDGGGRWQWATPTRSHWGLMVATSTTALICLVPVALVALAAPPDSYASLYGMGKVELGFAFVRYLSTIVPFIPITPEFNVGALLSDMAFFVLLTVGWRYYRQQPGHRSHSTLLLLFAFSLPLLGVISYLPWPSFQDFYGLPYLLGTAMLVAFAVSGFASLGARSTIIGLTIALIPFLYMLPSAHYATNRARASIALAHEVTKLLSRRVGSDTVIIAVKGPSPRQWFGVGATLARQATVNGDAFPPYIELPCAAAKERLAHSPYTPVVVFHSYCDRLGRPQRSAVQMFRWFDWARVRVIRDSAGADLFNLD